MKLKIYLSTVLLNTTVLCAQTTVNYNDVAVIVNDSSQLSIDIGNYFMLHRNIPTQNLIHIAIEEKEEINETEFNVVRQQIEQQLLNNNLLNSINYIVTTKGVPLKVASGNCDTLPFTQCASFDSEITLLFSPDSNKINEVGSTANYFFNTHGHFSRSNYNMFLVTRLDAYTKLDIINLIDRSGPDIVVDPSSSSVALDLDRVTIHDGYNEYNSIQNYVNARGYSSAIDTTADFISNHINTIGYSSFHVEQDTLLHNFTWKNGGIGVLQIRWSASTFLQANNTNPFEFKVADLIHEGASGAIGFIYPTWLSARLNELKVFQAYFDTVSSYNLAESYYKGLQFLSHHAVIIGDPKTSIKRDLTMSSIESAEKKDILEIYPNPTNGSVSIKTNQAYQISVYNQLGEVMNSKKLNIHEGTNTLDLSHLSNGTYWLSFEDATQRINKKLVISR